MKCPRTWRQASPHDGPLSQTHFIMTRVAWRRWIEIVDFRGGTRRSQAGALALVQVLECRIVMTADIVELATMDDNNPTLPACDCTFPDMIRVGETGVPISVAVSDPPVGSVIDIWIDWNRDGNWGGAAEHVASRVPVVDGDNVLRIDVPAWAKSGSVGARFKLMPQAGDVGVFQDEQFMLLPPSYPAGQFGSAHPISDVAAVQFTSTADLDRDGDLDILSATFDGSGTIDWYENDGSQGFTPHVITLDASEATCVIAVDIDGDGDLDVVASSLGNDTIKWYQNDGHQQFVAHTISDSASKVSNLFAADLDGDGDADLISATKGDNSIAWYENRGPDGFDRHVIVTNVAAPCAVSAADMDGDGDLDIVSASFSDNTVAWYQNNGQQVFVKRTISSTAGGVRGMFVADLDGDGDQDVVSSCLYANTLEWYVNDGQGLFSRRTIASSAVGAAAVYAADMDGDGDLDVLGASRGNTTLAWFENTGELTFPEHIVTTSLVEVRGVVAADVDQDGDLDIVAASKFGHTLTWYENRVNPSPITVQFETPGPEVSNDPIIPVTVHFNSPVTGFVADCLVTQNGTISNFAGDGSTFTFDLEATKEGTVTVSLAAGAVTNEAGYGNPTVVLSREYTVVSPALTLAGATTFARGGDPAYISPQLSVSGSRLGGGTLVVVVNEIDSRKAAGYDVVDDSALSILGVLTRTAVPGKQVTTVELSEMTTSNDIQAALRAMTFSTSKGGLHFKSREVRIKLTDNGGQSSGTVTQIIHVSKALHGRRSISSI